MAFSDAFRAYLQTPPPHRIATVLEIAWPGANPPARFGVADFPTTTDFYVGRILENGVRDPREGVDHKSAALQVLESTVTIIDRVDEAHRGTALYRDTQRILEGQLDPQRSVCTLLWASPDLDRSDWSVRLRGNLYSWSYHDSALVDLTLRTDDRWTHGDASRWPILKGEWPSAPDASLGVYLPVVYGTHLSTNLSGRGFIPTILVQTEEVEALRNRWDFVSLGYVTVTAVFRIRNNVPTQMVLASDYTILQRIVAGKACTIIQWNLSEDILTTDTIQCDVKGLTDLGGGGGVQLTNPVTELRHWLVNFAAPDPWLSGTYKPELLIEPTSWAKAEAYAQRFHLEGGFRVGGSVDQRSVLDFVNEWLDSWQRFRPHWTPDGRLAMKVLDYEWPGQGAGTHFDLIRQRDVLNRLNVQHDPSALLSRISATHLFDLAGKKNWGSMDAEDSGRIEKVTRTVRMIDSVSKFG